MEFKIGDKVVSNGVLFLGGLMPPKGCKGIVTKVESYNDVVHVIFDIVTTGIAYRIHVMHLDLDSPPPKKCHKLTKIFQD